MKIFATGASGFVGQRLLKRLQQEGGHEVTALSRSPSKDAGLEALGARCVRGSLEDIADWSQALAGQELVVHLASPIAVWGDWEKDFYRPITLASEQLLAACNTAGVKRFIYISSESVLQGEGPLLDVDEAHPYPAEPNSLYGKAKMLAEIAIREASVSTERIILRPSYIWGKGGTQLDQVIAKVRAGQFVWADRGEPVMEMVHVDNLVEAILLAATKGKDGETYFVTDDAPKSAKAFLGELLRVSHAEAGGRSLPGWLLRPLAAVVEGGWRLLHLPGVPPISRFQLDFIALPRRYRLDRIRRDLGYEPVTNFQQGLEEMASPD